MKLDKNYFTNQKFSNDELGKHYKSANRDLEIAKAHKEPEVKFHFTYMALLKIGIYVVAKIGYRVKSRPGHHREIIKALSNLLHDEDIMIIGDKMRKNRNLDLYDANDRITKKEADECLKFVEELYQKRIK